MFHEAMFVEGVEGDLGSLLAVTRLMIDLVTGASGLCTWHCLDGCGVLSG